MATVHPIPKHISLDMSWLRKGDPVYLGIAILLMFALAPLMVAMQLDARVFQGDPVWLKPTKFALALALYSATLGLFAAVVRTETRATLWWRGFRVLFAICVLLEMIWIGGAAANGVASHYNPDPLMMVIYQFMGLFATILTLASLVLAWAIARRGKALNVTLRDGLVWGLVLTFPLTLISAGTLSSMPGHFVGAHDPALGGAVFFGWARDVGDLRVGHFFATHALHAVPLIALLAMPLPQMLGRVIVALGALGYTGLVAFTFFQALQGQPFLPNLL